VIGSGNQRVSMSSIDMTGKATVAVLRDPDRFANRPAYFADYTASTNELVEILREIEGKDSWSTRYQPIDGLHDLGLQQWAADTEKGVQDRLNTNAYRMLGICALFDESNRYGADYSGSSEAGFGLTRDEFKTSLRKAVR
jgi:hypothetical protein